jgi:hypothetical protein
MLAACGNDPASRYFSVPFNAPIETIAHFRYCRLHKNHVKYEVV